MNKIDSDFFRKTEIIVIVGEINNYTIDANLLYKSFTVFSMKISSSPTREIGTCYWISGKQKGFANKTGKQGIY